MSVFTNFFQQNRSEVLKQRKVIKEALTSGSATVSDLAEKTGFPKDLILWNLMALLRWGEVEIAGETEDELLYISKEVKH